MYVATIQCLNYSGQEKNAVSDSDKTVTLKQNQSHQNWYKLVDSEGKYKHPSLKNVA